MSPAESLSRATPPSPSREDTPGAQSDDVRHQTDDDSGSESEPSKPKQKRARKSKAPQTVRKKYVRGKQGALQGIMKMPIEVFTEIACHITPADLISLVRTNKFFRSMLLRQSAILVWRRAQDNVPGLPPCPTEMSEPQYAALLFSKHCTLCGKSAMSKPDPWIQARLCSECRDTKLGRTTMNITEYRFVAISWFTKVQKGRRRNQFACFMLEEYDRAKKTLLEFLDNKDHEGLREWENKTRARLDTRCKEAEELIKFINSVEMSRERELEKLKSVRQDEVKERLKVLGWEEKYFDFWCSPDARQWDSLVRVPKPLTDRIWDNLSPKLIPLLEDNRDRIDQLDRQCRKSERQAKLVTLVEQLRDSMYPFHNICQALDLEVPLSVSMYAEAKRFLVNPFPAVTLVTSWQPLADIRDKENSLEVVEELFDAAREEVTQMVLNWWEKVERKLVEQYMRDVGKTWEMSSALTVKGSTDLTESLSPHARFLLRADTIFLPSYQVYGQRAEDKEHGPLERGMHFPALISGAVDTDVSHFERYFRHAGAERIAKALLKDMGMQNAAYAEVNTVDSVFACRRCGTLPCGSWEDLLLHYSHKLRQWSGGNFIYNKYATRHPIQFFHTHSLESGPNAKPFARMLSIEELKQARESFRYAAKFWCLICSGVSYQHLAEFISMDSLSVHMDDVHGITQDLVLDLHYTDDRRTAWSQSSRITAWQEKWDAHADAKAEADGTDDSRPESPDGSGASGST